MTENPQPYTKKELNEIEKLARLNKTSQEIANTLCRLGRKTTPGGVRKVLCKFRWRRSDIWRDETTGGTFDRHVVERAVRGDFSGLSRLQAKNLKQLVQRNGLPIESWRARRERRRAAQLDACRSNLPSFKLNGEIEIAQNLGPKTNVNISIDGTKTGVTIGRKTVVFDGEMLVSVGPSGVKVTPPMKRRGRKIRRKRRRIHLCECGCGMETSRPEYHYIRGHNPKRS